LQGDPGSGTHWSAPRCSMRYSRLRGQVQGICQDDPGSGERGHCLAPQHSYAFILHPRMRSTAISGHSEILQRSSSLPHPCDAASLVAFTARAGRPVITGVMGSGFRHLRAFLPFFGSAAVYCHVGTLMSEGQYEVGEMISLLSLLGGKGAPRMTGPRRVRDYPENE